MNSNIEPSMKSYSSPWLAPALALFLVTGTNAQDANAPAEAAKVTDSPVAQKDANSYSGMYTFLKEGEFVQLTVEDDGRVTGFISRFGDNQSDKDAFLDQFFKSGKLDGNKLTFTTKLVHGVDFDFKGKVERGNGKNPGDDGYYVLKGTLTQNVTDTNKKVTSHTQDVALKKFPQDVTPETQN